MSISFYREREFKDTEIGRIPKDWEVVRLGNICKFKRGFSYRSNQITNDQTPLRFITINDIEKEGGIKRNAERIYIKDPSEVNAEFLVNNGDVLIANTDMTKGLIIGAPILIKNLGEKCTYSMDLTRLIFDKTKIYGDFLFYYLMHPQIRHKMKSSAQGTNVLHLNHELISDFLIPIQSVTEQQKIAEILSTVDEAIQKTNEIIAKTERLKKGLMQELLTKGIGHKEYKQTQIGTIPKEWEVAKLKDIVEINKESRDPSKEMPDKTFLYVDIDSVDGGTGKIRNPKRILGKEAPSRARRVIHENDIIMSTVRPYLRAFAIVPRELDNQICSTGFAVLSCRSNIVPYFLLNVLFSDKTINQCNRMMMGGQYPALNQSQVSEIMIPLPSLHEQKRIADIFLSIDKKLELEKNEKKSRLERIKQGLMDLLLTGKIRVKL
ncbi:MAG: restriction endonuclease subunit S [Candidatus Nitrosocaldus sp.]